MASSEVLEAYGAALASQMSAGTLGELEHKNLPSVEALTVPGEFTCFLCFVSL